MTRKKTTTQKKTPLSLPFEEVVYVLQGGGALGAYQVGIAAALAENGYEPNWVVGASIGAINAGIIAGNEPSERITKLKKFWDIISRPTVPLFIENEAMRRIHNSWSAYCTLLFGQTDFFSPRWPSPYFSFSSSPDSISFYDTKALRTTLEKLIDFDRINNGKTRLSLAAVEVRTGQRHYFESREQKIGPEHIMASAALPPGFPAVEIDGKMYWDGGLSSNTPVAHVLRSQAHNDHLKQRNSLCFCMQLFDSYGLLPQSLDDILKRKKDITFASQYYREIQARKEIHRLRSAIRLLSEAIPEKRKLEPEIKSILDHNQPVMMHLVRFLYHGKTTDLSSKDYEFSKLSVAEHIQAGYEDGKTGVLASPWLTPVPDIGGIFFHEISGQLHNAAETL
jgi:NTE family protein